MVNTFVPYNDIQACAKALDYRRLGKQRVEAYQLWRALRGISKGWRNHPATLAWQGHTCALAMYTNAMIAEWIARGYKNTMSMLPHCPNPRFPWWWGWAPLMLSHQASLNRKDPSFYNFEVGQYIHHGYIWPSKVPRALWFLDDPPLDQVCAPITATKVRRPKQ
jgi:hypothetical protein